MHNLYRNLYLTCITLLTTLFLSINIAMAGLVVAPPPPGQYIVDQAHVLSASQKHELNQLIYELDKRTKAQIGVAIVNSLEGQSIEEYSLSVLRQWGIGDKKLNNGMVLVVDLKAHKARIDVGYGLEGAINDAKAGRLLDTYAIPYFKQEQYAQGIVETTKAMAVLTAKSYNVNLDAQPQEAATTDYGNIGSMLLLILVVLFILFGSKKGGNHYGGFGGGSGGGFGGGTGGGGGSSRRW